MKTKKFYRCNGRGRLWIRGGRSHFFRLRLRSCSKIFESGSVSGSGNFSNVRIRLLFRLRLQSRKPKITNGLTLVISSQTPATTEIEEWLRSCSKFLNPDPGPEIFQIWESDSCSDSDYNHRSNRNLPLFSLKKEPQRLLLLPKWKSDSGSRSGFSQIFGSGSERKTQNPAGVDSGTSDPVPPLLWMCWSCCKTYFSQIRNVLSTIGIYRKEFFHSNAQIKLKLGEIYISRLSVFELWRSENVDHMHVGYWELFISKARNVQQNHHSNKGHSDGVSLFDV